jgi:hypothetical protein
MRRAREVADAGDKLRELIAVRRGERRLVGKVHRLACRLIEAPSLDATLDTLYLDLLDHFADAARRRAPVERRRGEPGHARNSPGRARDAPVRRADAGPLLRPHAVYESQAWFGEAAPHLKSFALVALRVDGRPSA